MQLDRRHEKEGKERVAALEPQAAVVAGDDRIANDRHDARLSTRRHEQGGQQHEGKSNCHASGLIPAVHSFGSR
jgi:hypothetical protein